MEQYIKIDLNTQCLRLVQQGNTIFESVISSAKNGPGELSGSECTPRGQHIVRAKIGEGCDVNSVFVGRRPTGEVYTPELGRDYPDRDWILTRILWLSGMQPGFNRLGKVDTMRRYIYIHGTPDEVNMGVADSHGCIRMCNADIVTLFDLVPAGIVVEIA